MRLKDFAMTGRPVPGTRGNWGGFSFEIESLSLQVAPPAPTRGNWGGFSFEIERSRRC